MINRVILVGNLVRDAELVPTDGKPMTKMRLATHHQWKDAEGDPQEAAEFHAVVCFDRLAEVCALYCSKGRRVYIEGRMRTREFVDGEGVRRLSTEVVAQTVKLLQSRASKNGASTADVAVGETA